MGKSTLVGVAAARSGLAVGWGTGAEAERTPAFWPWTAALRALLSTVDPAEVAELTGTDAAELARLLPQLADGTGASDPDSPTDAGAARLRLFDAVARFLERLARRRPTMVVLDDLQWADESSLQLLEFITQPVRPVPLVIVGAYRHDELDTDAARDWRGSLLVGSCCRCTGCPRARCSSSSLRLSGVTRPGVGPRRYIGVVAGTRSWPASSPSCWPIRPIPRVRYRLACTTSWPVGWSGCPAGVGSWSRRPPLRAPRYHPTCLPRYAPST